MITENIIKELVFKAVRSSGAGGQHVNKVSSKVVLSFDLKNSNALSSGEKEILVHSLSTRLTNQSILNLSCDESRSQLKNKKIVTARFLSIIEKGLFVAKNRIPTKPSKGSIKRKKTAKRKTSEKKTLRKKPDLE